MNREHRSIDRPGPGKVRVAVVPDTSKPSPYRLLHEDDSEVTFVNDFLDATALRGLSKQSLRTYAYCGLSIWRWLEEAGLSVDELSENHLAEFILHLREGCEARSPPAARSINLRLIVARAIFRFHTGFELPRAPGMPLEAMPVFVQSSRVGTRGVRRTGRPVSLRVRVPRSLVEPLTRAEAIRFFESFRTSRDLAIVSLMLFCGLRSREVLALKTRDVNVAQEELRVRGKGGKDRVLPLASYVRRAVTTYVEIERPRTPHDALFVNLKGRARGEPMTPEGLRGLFRYHRTRSGITSANPHRFRHTFAVDMIRENMPLPVLMRLMGHANIEMTMRYVNLSAEDIRGEFERAIRRLSERPEDGRNLSESP